jgi:sugar phosphate isomerase/epimerase
MTLGTPGAASALSAAAQNARPSAPRLGLDLFSLGTQLSGGWGPTQLMEFAARNGVKMVHFSEIRFLGNPDWKVALDPATLRSVRTKADELGLDVEIGMRSICPTSSSFDKAAGTAEEQIARMVDAAKVVRSPIVRCFLGTQNDRRTDIDRHIDETIKVLKNSRARIMDAGVKIAIENHAGDMQARELKRLIEGAGKEFVGACIDSGNAVWTIEDPHLTLETLAPYVLTSHVRDSYVWLAPQGTAVQWQRMGDGNIGMEDWIRKYVQQCPGAPVSLEVIVSNAPRVFNYKDPAAWELFKTTPAWEFARFLALCEKGEPRPMPPAAPGRGQGAAAAGSQAAAAGNAGRGQAPAAPPAGAPAAGAAAGGRGGGGGGGGRGGAPSPDALRRNIEDVETSLKWTAGVLARI